MDNDELRPMSIPETILKDPKAINLYMVAVVALAVIGVASIVGAMALAFFDKVIPDAAWAIVGLAVGALAAAIKGSGE